MSDRSGDDLYAEVFGVDPAMSSFLLKTPLSLHAHANHISFFVVVKASSLADVWIRPTLA